uniref:Uncharacterized protein n=1 Tax=Oryza meridionalis TaxID=40149 RepID=A0A0E0CX07_9ORYZ
MSRQAKKEAAAAAQDMLKLDAARMRKPAASQSRKGGRRRCGRPREELGRSRWPLVPLVGSGGEFFASGEDGGDEDTVLEEIDPAEKLGYPAASTHRQLKNDLVEHIWQRYGPRGG